MLNPRARICSRPSSVIFSGPQGGIQTQLRRHSSTIVSTARPTWSSITSVSGQAAVVSDGRRSEEHTSELQARFDLVCRLLLEKKNYFNRHKLAGRDPNTGELVAA